MENYERKICALPGCGKLGRSWRLKFCCRSHAGKYAALSRYSDEIKAPLSSGDRAPRLKKNKPLLKLPTFDEIVGPILPRKVRKTLERGESVDRRKFMPRNDLLKLATPSWAKIAEIEKIYAERDRLNATGTKHHVDHIIPLNHPLVCGLHVESNLRVILKEHNEKKNNTFIIE